MRDAMPARSTRRRDADPDRTTVRRVDRGAPLLGKPYRRADGTLLCEAIVSAPGVLRYRDAAGKEWLELVTEETLADPDYLAALGRAVVTLEHPEEDVTPDNVGAYQAGDTDGAVEVLEGGFVKARLAVRRRDALTAIDSGVEEISPGYDVELDETPGTHPIYGRYDAIQKKRRLNHLAIVPKGRSGPDVRLRADSAYQVLPTPETGKMEELLKQLLAAMSGMREDIAANALKMDGYFGKKDAPPGDAPPTNPPAENMDMQKKMDAEIAKRADARAALLLLAKTHSVEVKPEHDALTIKRAIAKIARPALRADASEAYCDDVIAELEQRQDADDLPPADPYEGLRGKQNPRGDADDDFDPIAHMRKMAAKPRT